MVGHSKYERVAVTCTRKKQIVTLHLAALGQVVQSWVNPGLVQKLNLDMKPFKGKFNLIHVVYNSMIPCSKKNKKNYPKKNAFEQTKKKPALKFNPRTLE